MTRWSYGTNLQKSCSFPSHSVLPHCCAWGWVGHIEPCRGRTWTHGSWRIWYTFLGQRLSPSIRMLFRWACVNAGVSWEVRELLGFYQEQFPIKDLKCNGDFEAFREPHRCRASQRNREAGTGRPRYRCWRQLCLVWDVWWLAEFYRHCCAGTMTKCGSGPKSGAALAILWYAIHE